ncbi:hypothetical protein [Tropicimonas sp. IMCC34043]|uniref:hypothetical protein n=1 Tax=Tropicimonas sp. IMCC34043 TaxID=2248760 RepID=UPI0013005D1A|nr:hypothetical protein [Tropicimonas sp. IMCC34043]
MGILFAATLVAICATIVAVLLDSGILIAVLVYIGSGTTAVFALLGWVLLRDHIASTAQPKTKKRDLASKLMFLPIVHD